LQASCNFITNMNYALITGASKGIGKAIAFELARRKYAVILVARNEILLQELSATLRNQFSVEAEYFAIDLTQKDAPQKIVQFCADKNLKIQILVNNAGYGLSGGIDKYNLSQHTEMMQLNMHVPVSLTYLLLPQLKLQKAGYILNVASGASYQAVPGLNIYAASKAFVLSFSRGLNYELKNTSVSVTALSPGATDTDFANRASVTSAKAQKLAKQFNMQPQEVASIAVNGMFSRKAEVIPGFVNKLAVFFAWLLPKKLLEKSAAGIYDL
jgi:short-subunit dehydrogenase